MTWSYSRITCFHECKYRWYLRYIDGLDATDLFFTSYGSFMHKLIESAYNDGASRQRLAERYLSEFRENVRGAPPSRKVFESYFNDGLRYLNEFKTLPFTPVSVEKKIAFSLEGKSFVGIIDFLGDRDGGLFIIDNKSRNLKQRSKRSKPTKTDGELDKYLRQLYLYAAAVKQEYGRLPTGLGFNCFRRGELITESFNNEAYEQTIQWALKSIDDIGRERDFNPDMEYFKCSYLCDMRDCCDYFEHAWWR